MVTLLDSQLSEAEKQEAYEALVGAGAPDKTFKGVLKSALKKLGEQIADESGGAVADDMSGFIGTLLERSMSSMRTIIERVFSSADEAKHW